ncbi:MAG: RNA polymerase sigma factor [Chthonomonadales bacterium]
MAEQYRGIAFAYAFAVLRHREEAEDVVQEAMVKAMTAAHRYRTEDAWGPWFLSIVRNLCRDAVRRKRTRDTVTLAENILDPSPSPEVAVLLGERRAILAAAVERLPDEQRVPLLMHYTLGLTLAETGLALGLRRSTVMGRIAAGLRRLRRILRETAE